LSPWGDDSTLFRQKLGVDRSYSPNVPMYRLGEKTAFILQANARLFMYPSPTRIGDSE